MATVRPTPSAAVTTEEGTRSTGTFGRFSFSICPNRDDIVSIVAKSRKSLSVCKFQFILGSITTPNLNPVRFERTPKLLIHADQSRRQSLDLPMALDKGTSRILEVTKEKFLLVWIAPIHKMSRNCRTFFGEMRQITFHVFGKLLIKSLQVMAKFGFARNKQMEKFQGYLHGNRVVTMVGAESV